MSEVRVITTPSLEGKRCAFVLAEDRIGQNPEFRTFFVNTFNLDRVGLGEPGYVVAPSGMEYVFVFVGRSGEPFPVGVEIHALVPALESLNEEAVEPDLGAILRWMIRGVGGAWTVADLEVIGRSHRTQTEIG